MHTVYIAFFKTTDIYLQRKALTLAFTSDQVYHGSMSTRPSLMRELYLWHAFTDSYIANPPQHSAGPLDLIEIYSQFEHSGLSDFFLYIMSLTVEAMHLHVQHEYTLQGSPCSNQNAM